MNDTQKHYLLVNEYKEADQTVRKLRMQGFAFQAILFAILLFIKFLSKHTLPLATTFAFGVFLLSRLKSFNFRRNLDIKMSKLTVEGLQLEQSNPRFDPFFLEILRKFGILRTIVLRAMLDIVALYFFSYAIYNLVLNYQPDFVLRISNYYPIIGILGFFLGDLYYKPFTPLLSNAQKSLSNSSE